jgi:hypothetical protein
MWVGETMFAKRILALVKARDHVSPLENQHRDADGALTQDITVHVARAKRHLLVRAEIGGQH